MSNNQELYQKLAEISSELEEYLKRKNLIRHDYTITVRFVVKKIKRVTIHIPRNLRNSSNPSKNRIYVAQMTDELNESDWDKILSYKLSLPAKDFLIKLKEDGNCPMYLKKSRYENINYQLSKQAAPFRLRTTKRVKTWSEMQCRM